ncbi:MAG: hypothetical protein KDI09_04945 [Halioglobus sp.]|nr:hypothetical protein [Halioglobus sp.]
MPKPDKPTQVCLTIDTEFSIAGHFDSPETCPPVSEPMVYGRVNDKEEALGFLLDTLHAYDISATFFVECANYFYFGDEPMRSVVARLNAAGQDIQLHVHPVWLNFVDGELPGYFPRNDFCSARSFDDLKRVFELCIEVFERWVGKSPVAIRTGSLHTDENVYRVMQALGIPLSSNIAMGVYEPSEPLLRHDSGRHLIHGVMELPVFTYQDMQIGSRTRRKSLQITSCSWPEMRHLLWKAREAGVENIVVLTHPSEFIKKTDFRYTRLTRNRVNQERLRKLCAFIQSQPEEFVSADFATSLSEWKGSELHQPFITIPSGFSLLRKLHNRLNDSLWWY